MRSLIFGYAARRGYIDPAPSVWVYRYQRWMLTPGFRTAVRVGIPLLLIVVIATSWFSSAPHRAQFTQAVAEMRATVQDRPEFIVGAMAIDGADPSLTAQIRDRLALNFPVSSFLLDIAKIRADLMALPPVADATVRVKPGGILEIDVTQRVPVAVWRHVDGLRLIDTSGAYVGAIAARGDRGDLPLIAGDGVQDAIGEAMALFAAAAPIRDHVRGLVRMGERRWDMVLDGDKRILLPETESVQALERVIAIDRAQDLFARDITIIDMRNGQRPTLRMGPAATEALRGFNPTPLATGAGN